MKKFIYITLVSLIFLSACSSQETVLSSAGEAIRSLDENVTLTNSSSYMDLEGEQPESYKLANGEVIVVYEFDSEAKREAGKKEFEKRTLLLSTHAPIVYQAGNYLALYYSTVDSNNRTPELKETKYGVKIEKSLQSIQQE